MKATGLRNLAESGIYRGSWIVREVSIIDGGYHQCACLFLYHEQERSVLTWDNLSD